MPCNIPINCQLSHQTTKPCSLQENTIIVILLSQHEFTKILLLLETRQRPIGDQSETNMPDWRPQHASLETDMPDRRPIGDLNMLHRRSTCLIGDPLKTDMPQR